jgi:hypothetical protein
MGSPHKTYIDFIVSQTLPATVPRLPLLIIISMRRSAVLLMLAVLLAGASSPCIGRCWLSSSKISPHACCGATNSVAVKSPCCTAVRDQPAIPQHPFSFVTTHHAVSALSVLQSVRAQRHSEHAPVHAASPPLVLRI